MLRTRLAGSALAATICCLIGPVSAAQPDAQIAKGRTQEVDSIDVTSPERLHAALVARKARRQQLAATVKGSIEELFAAKDYAALEAIPRRWRKTLPPDVQRELVVQLLAKVESEQPLALELPDHVAIRYGRPARTDSADVVLVAENLLAEGGRSVWAIRELLLISPYNQIDPPEVDIPPLAIELSQQVIRAMAMPDWARFEALSLEERARLASSADSDPRLLRELAKSPEVEVRLAVAKNLFTAYSTLKRRLLKDPDARVRDAARKNLYHARAIALPIGE